VPLPKYTRPGGFGAQFWYQFILEKMKLVHFVLLPSVVIFLSLSALLKSYKTMGYRVNKLTF